MSAIPGKLAAALCSLIALLGLPAKQAAAEYPEHPLTIVVPFSPGGGHDFTARLMASKLTAELGQQVIVVNKPGANGMIGAQFVAQGPADGYAMLMSSPAETVISPLLYKDMQYDPRKDLSPVTLVGVTPIALIAHPSLPYRSVPELIEYARRNPGKVGYGTPGVGSAHHLAVDWIARLTGIQLLDVPYKGAGPATADVLANQIPLASVGMAPVMPNWKAGKVKVLAIMNNKRLPWLPDVPTASEAPGADPVDVVQWMGVFVSAATPPAIVDRLNQAYARVLEDPEVRATMIAQGVDAVGNSTQEFAAYLDRERAKYASLVKDAGIVSR